MGGTKKCAWGREDFFNVFKQSNNAAFVKKYSKNFNIVKYDYNIKYLFCYIL